MFRSCSAIESLAQPGGAGFPIQREGLYLSEVRGWSFIQISLFSRTHPESQRALRAIVDVQWPTQVGHSVASNETYLLRTGAEQFWILLPNDETNRMAHAIDPAIGCITDLSHSRVCIRIEGTRARRFLQANIPVDLHALEVERFVLTGLHHTPVLLMRMDEDCYHIYLLRTFAAWLCEALVDASLTALR